MTSIADLANLAAQTTDHTETTQGGDFEYTPAPAGKTVGRFIEYIELGKQKQRPYQGKPKADAEEARLTFELVAPKNIKEIDVDGGKKKIADRISFNIAVKLGDKAGFKKLFETMRRGREDKKHMAQMLGEGFIIEVVHNTSGEGENKRTYANMKTEAAGWLISAPVIEDPIAGTRVDVKVPEALSPMKIFLWDHPSKETWDSLFIDGTRTTKVDGKDVEQSKNWLQTKIIGASNYEGSTLQAMLAGVDKLSIDPETSTDTIPDEPVATAKATDAGAAQKAAEALAAKQANTAKAQAETAAGGLAELGL